MLCLKCDNFVWAFFPFNFEGRLCLWKMFKQTFCFKNSLVHFEFSSSLIKKNKIKTNSWLILIPSNGVPTQHAGQVALHHLLLPTAPDPLGWYNNWWHIEVENPNQSGLISKVQMIHFISPLKTKTKMSTTNEKLSNYSKLHLKMVYKLFLHSKAGYREGFGKIPFMKYFPIL